MDRRDFLTMVRTTVEHYRLVERGDLVVVGLSGGADSCALLISLLRLREDYGIGLHVAHLNHGLRGADADGDADFCEALANRLDLPYSGGVEDVGRLTRHRGVSLEEAARETRYRFLDSVHRQQNAQRLAVGHTADDLAETFFLNLFRGSGLDGLVALRPKRDGYLVRPLLDCTHAEAERFCTDCGVAWREDATNRDQRFQRNRVRRQLLPLIREQLCPDVVPKIGRLSHLLRDDRDDLEHRAGQLLTQATRNAGPAGLELDAHALLAASPAVARRALRAAVATVKGSRHNISLAHIERCLALLRDPRGSREVPLPGVRCLLESDRRLLISSESSPELTDAGPARFRQPLQIPGRTEIPPLGIVLEAEHFSADGTPAWGDCCECVLLDADAVGPALWVRVPRPGDRFRPLGMSGTKKLSDLFIDAKVPRRSRRLVPVIENGKNLVWVVGHRLDDRAKITPQTRRVLQLSLRPLAGR